jgi:hypothetical protein
MGARADLAAGLRHAEFQFTPVLMGVMTFLSTAVRARCTGPGLVLSKVSRMSNKAASDNLERSPLTSFSLINCLSVSRL